MTKELAVTIATKIASSTSDALDARAAACGITRGELVRIMIQAGLGEAVQKPRELSPVHDAAELRRLLAELGRLGGLLNQIARAMNIGGATPEARAALTSIQHEYPLAALVRC